MPCHHLLPHTNLEFGKNMNFLTVPKLRELCRARGLDQTGKKAELVARLQKLYPTVAISDAFNTVLHAAAAVVVLYKPTSGNEAAAIGFALVAIASFVGTLRFGFSTAFAPANESLAGLAAFVGLPLIGSGFLCSAVGYQEDSNGLLVAFTAACASIHVVARAYLSTEHLDLLKVLVNVFFFLSPALYYAYTQRQWLAAGGSLLFAFAAVVIGADREEFLFGVRRENLFHYAIGTAALMLAESL